MPRRSQRKKRRATTGPRLFISYSREDDFIVGTMAEMIRLGGPAVFRDTDSLSPGDEWQPTISKAISECDAFVIFWCRHAQASKSVRAEWEQALDEKKRIVPVLLDETPLPDQLGRYQWIDCRSLIAETSHNDQGPPVVIRRAFEPTHLAGLQARQELWAILSRADSGPTARSDGATD